MRTRSFAPAVAAAILAFATALPASGGTGALDRTLATALEVPGVVSANSTGLAVELPSGRILYARNPELSLQPASNEKLSVTYGALVELGPSYRFPTEVLGEGGRSGSAWEGSLVLKGFGDPTLSTADLNRVVNILHREGIRSVTGSIIGDASYFDSDHTAPGWLPSFAGAESPPLSSLIVDRGDHNGFLVADPPLAAAVDFTTLLHAHGITTGPAATGTADAAAHVVATIYSDPLAQIIEFMDQYSDNFTAEMVLKAIGAHAFGLGTTAGGARVVTSVLADARVPLTGVRIVDGSGLSRWDRATGAELGALLVRIWDNPTVRGIVLDGLPVAGESGTLAYRMTSAPSRGIVRAKTGTTDIASALSGFVGARYAFVAIENGDPVNWDAARAAQDRFADVLASQLPAASG